jgi:hypothetical protein
LNPKPTFLISTFQNPTSRHPTLTFSLLNTSPFLVYYIYSYFLFLFFNYNKWAGHQYIDERGFLQI